MATILVTWELGGGLGHLMPLRPLVRGLVERGHRVFAALKDLSRAADVLGRDGVSYLQAPFRLGQVAGAVAPARTFAHVLHNVGLGDAEGLRTLAAAWRSLYEYVRPEVIIFDHSPTALLAARGWPVKRVGFGTPFTCPPDEYPMRDLRPWLARWDHKPASAARGGQSPSSSATCFEEIGRQARKQGTVLSPSSPAVPPSDPDGLRRDEDRVLDSVNQVVRSWGGSALDRLAGLYHPADETILTTFAELDCYANRDGTEHWGAWPSEGGQPPEWPEAPGKRVFAYLKAFPARASLLAMLAELRCSTLVYLDRDDPKLRRRLQSAMLRFAERRLDLSVVSRQCDLAILNAGHATTAAMLLAGRPILQLPIYLEQMLNAAAAGRLGAALSAPVTRPEQIAVKLMALLASARYKEAAARFAQRYADFDPEQQIDKALRRIEELAASA